MNTIKTKGPLLTAVVPVTLMANRLSLLEGWIKNCTEKSIEIILLHDIRDEETSQELKKIVSSNLKLNIVIFEEKFGSPGTAKNLGIEIANGEWITFWDSDDIPNVDAVLNVLNSELDKGNFEVIIGQFNVYDVTNSRLIERERNDSSFSDVAMNPGIWRMLFRNDSIGDVRFPSFKMAEDQNFLSALQVPEKKTKFIDDILYTYHLGNLGQLTSQKSAVDEILSAARFTLLRIKDSKGQTREFNATLYSRQIITGITKGSLKVKLMCINLFIKSIASNDDQCAKVVIRKLFKILLQRNRRKLA